MTRGRKGKVARSDLKAASSPPLDDRNVDWSLMLTCVKNQNTLMEKAEKALCDIYLKAIFGPYQEEEGEEEEREKELPVMENLRKQLYTRFCKSIREGNVHEQVEEPILFTTRQLDYLESQDWTGDRSGNRYSFQKDADRRADSDLQLHARQVILQAIEFYRYIKRGDCKTLPVSSIPVSLLKKKSDWAKPVDTNQARDQQHEAQPGKVYSQLSSDSDRDVDFVVQRRTRASEVSVEKSPHFYIQQTSADFYLLAKEKDYTLGIQLELEKYLSALEKHTRVQPVVQQLISSMEGSQIVSDEEKLHRLNLLGKLIHYQESIASGSSVRTAGKSLAALANPILKKNGRSKLQERRVSFNSDR